MAVFAEMIFVVILVILSQVNCDDSAEMKAYWGQEGTTFGDGKSCYRNCDGYPKLCYYKFDIEHYNTMGAPCGDCANNVTSDCFNPNCVIANGLERNAITVNRGIPGPTISVCQGDEVIVDVKNHMSGSVMAIHWHGLHHVFTPWMDGVPMVTQCPILPGNKFRYRFLAEQAGTHYWHAHTGVHRAEGVFGKFIVRIPKDDEPNGDLYDFDLNEHSIMLTDWTRKMAAEYEPGTTNGRIKVDNLLIDGLGCDTNRNETNCDVMPVTTIPMQFGKRCRMRVDNSGNQNCPFEITMQRHNLTVIATDGFPIKPRTVDALVTSSGERYDFVVHAQTNRKIKELYLRVRALGGCGSDKIQSFARIIFVEDQKKYTKIISHARPYSDQIDYNVPFKQNAVYLNKPGVNCRSTKDLCVADLQQKGVAYPSGGNMRYLVPNRVIPLRFAVGLSNLEPSHVLTVGKQHLLANINNIVHMDTPFPVLTQDDSSVSYCNESTVAYKNATENLHFCHHKIQLQRNEVVDFELRDVRPPGDVSHPVHLHGHAFQVIDMGTSEELNSNKTPYCNDTHPPNVKDTVVIPSGGFVVIRLRATNPGFWYLHCHFEWHMHVGMRLVVQVGHRSQMLSPPKGFPTCNDYSPSVFTK